MVFGFGKKKKNGIIKKGVKDRFFTTVKQGATAKTKKGKGKKSKKSKRKPIRISKVFDRTFDTLEREARKIPTRKPLDPRQLEILNDSFKSDVLLDPIGEPKF